VSIRFSLCDVCHDLIFILISPYLHLSRSLHSAQLCGCFACMSSLRPMPCNHPPHKIFQYIWSYLDPQPRPIFNQGACLHFSHGLFYQSRGLLKPRHTYTTCFLWPNHPHELPNPACSWHSTSWLLSGWASSPFCYLAIEYDLARCSRQLCLFQYPSPELQQAWPRTDYPKEFLLDCHSWKFCLVLGPWLSLYRIEHVQLGLLDCSQKHGYQCAVWNKHWNGNEYPYL
jgi:hypothetical protein